MLSKLLFWVIALEYVILGLCIIPLIIIGAEGVNSNFALTRLIGEVPFFSALFLLFFVPLNALSFYEAEEKAKNGDDILEA